LSGVLAASIVSSLLARTAFELSHAKGIDDDVARDVLGEATSPLPDG